MKQVNNQSGIYTAPILEFLDIEVEEGFQSSNGAGEVGQAGGNITIDPWNPKDEF